MPPSPIFKYLFSVLLTLTLFMQSVLAAESPNASETPAGKPLEKVTLQLKWLHQFQFAGYYAAKIKGFYADEGLEAVSKGQAYAYVDNVAVVSHILKKENLTNLQISGETATKPL